MSGWSGRQPYRFCVRTARPAGASLTTATAVSLMTCSFLRVGLKSPRTCTARRRAGWRRRVRPGGRHDRSERVLRPALAEPGEEGENQQREAPAVRVCLWVDREVDQSAADGERDRHREDAS